MIVTKIKFVKVKNKRILCLILDIGKITKKRIRHHSEHISKVNSTSLCLKENK